MIKVKNLSKFYNDNQVLKNVSFEITKGEIVGFLGPNGAGKTTTLKILTGYMLPNEGDVIVDNVNIFDDPIKIKEKIGYLPENNPLYMDFTVEEYLGYHLNIRNISGNKKIKAIEYAVTCCGLNDVYYKPISSLSKGFRQRVGIAQTILHKPEILILDEPTTGLDPRQILEIRELLKELGKEHTIIFSSHIMQEVEAICSRIIIINKGEIVAEGDPKNIGKNKEDEIMITLKILAPEEDVRKLLDKKYNICKIKEKNNITEVTIFINENIEKRMDLLKYLVKENAPVASVIPQESNLEEVFLSLTS